MSKTMNLLTFLMTIFLLNSCDQAQEEKPLLIENNNMITNDKNKYFNLDSVYIEYWKSTEANEYYFQYSDNIIQISSLRFSFNKKISKETIVSEFLNYINRFYIEKEKIIFSKKKTGYITSSHPPIITVKLFKKGDVVLEQETQMGSETHKIEYNPKFIEFYEFLDGLVTEN